MNFYDIDEPIELYNYIKQNIKYGFISSKDKNIYRRKIIGDKLYEEEILNNYYLQSPKELLENKVGICFDQVELIRYWLDRHNIINNTYYLSFHNHAIIIYKLEDKYYLFETSLPDLNGIYKENSLIDSFKKCKSIQEELNTKSIKRLVFHKYDKPEYNTDFFKYVRENNSDLEGDYVII